MGCTKGLQKDGVGPLLAVFLCRVTTLRLKKSSLWSVDSDILDYRGFYVFRKTGHTRRE